VRRSGQVRTARRALHMLFRHNPANITGRHQRAVAQVMGHHDRRVQRCKIERCNGLRIVPGVGMQHGGTLICNSVGLVSPFQEGTQETRLLGIPYDLTEHLNAPPLMLDPLLRRSLAPSTTDMSTLAHAPLANGRAPRCTQ
jgi:hypothetical protein